MYNRRQSLKLLGALSGTMVAPAIAEEGQSAGSHESTGLDVNSHQSTWQQDLDRIWLGAKYWANPMENWAVVDGAAELVSAAGYRNVHLLTHQLTNPAGSFRMQAAVSEVQHGDVDSSVGFLIGVRSELNELKSNCFAANNGPRKTKRAGGAIASGPVVAGVR
ncbi:MAG: DUF1080 domain-containing protein, partial [Rhodopirellula sp. JB053]